MTIPATEEDFGGLSMWAADANRAFSTPEMQARIAKAYPLRRVGKPEDVAPTVVFLASDAAAFITGHTVSVSGGYTVKLGGRDPMTFQGLTSPPGAAVPRLPLPRPPHPTPTPPA